MKKLNRCYTCGGLRKTPRGYENMDLAECACETEDKIPSRKKTGDKKHLSGNGGGKAWGGTDPIHGGVRDK